MKYKKQLTVCLGLFLVSGYFSITALDLFSSLIAMFVFLDWWQKPRSERLVLKSGAEKIILAWIFIVALGFLLSQAPILRVIKYLVDFKWFILMMAMATALKYIQPSGQVFRSFLWMTIFVSVYTLVTFYLKYDFFRIDPKTGELEPMIRAHGFLGNAMTFGLCYGGLFCFLISETIVSIVAQKKSWLLYIASALLGAAVFFSYTRIVWLGLLAAIALVIYFVNRKSLLIFTIVISSSIMGLYFYSPTFSERVKETFDQKSDSTAERLYIWKANIQIWKENPILGLGYGENGRRLDEYYNKLGITEIHGSTHAHNQYLHFLAGTGILGLAMYLAFIGYFLKLSISLLCLIPEDKMHEKSLLLGAIAVQVFTIVTNMAESSFEDSKARFIWMFSIAVIVYFKNRYNQKAQQI